MPGLMWLLIFGSMLPALPHVSPREGGRAARVLRLMALLPSARALFGVVCGALGILLNFQFSSEGALVGLFAMETWGRRSPIFVVTEGTAEQEWGCWRFCFSTALFPDHSDQSEALGRAKRRIGLGGWLSFCCWVSQVERSFVAPLLSSVSLSFSTLCVLCLSRPAQDSPSLCLPFLFLIYPHYGNFCWLFSPLWLFAEAISNSSVKVENWDVVAEFEVEAHISWVVHVKVWADVHK